MRIYTFINQKGGVAKTTTALCTAYGLARKGYKVLVVDFDPQQNLSMSAGIDLNKRKQFYYVMKELGDIREAINQCDGIDVVTLGLDGVIADLELNSFTGREYLLKKELDQVKDEYDFCIIDTSTHLGVLNQNALTVTDGIIIPISATDSYALMGFHQLTQKFIYKIKEMTNPGVDILGVLITRYTKSSEVANIMMQMIPKKVESDGIYVFDTVIRHSDKMPLAQIDGTNIYEFSKTSNAARDYLKFTEEFLERIGE